jgi:hypothetical protein
MDDIENDLNLLRSLVARELETVNAYRRLAADCGDESTVEFFRHVIDEEKIHIADTLRAIAVLDASQQGLFRRGFENGHGAGDESHGLDRIAVIKESSTAVGSSLNFLESKTQQDLGNRLLTSRIAGRSDSSSTDSTDDPADRQPDRGGPDRKANRMADAWTVGSLRGVPQYE